MQHSVSLFPDTELAENIFEQIVGCYCAGNFAEIVQSLLNVHRKEIGSYIAHAAQYTVQGLFGFLQRVQVAYIRYQRFFCVEFIVYRYTVNLLFKFVNI